MREKLYDEIINKAIAADLRIGPLENAKLAVESYNYSDKIQQQDYVYKIDNGHANMGFEYTQLGQEGGFTWERISEAYKKQMQFAIENKKKFGYEFK